MLYPNNVLKMNFENVVVKYKTELCAIHLSFGHNIIVSYIFGGRVLRVVAGFHFKLQTYMHVLTKTNCFRKDQYVP